MRKFRRYSYAVVNTQHTFEHYSDLAKFTKSSKTILYAATAFGTEIRD